MSAITDLKAELAEIYSKIQMIQSLCSHPAPAVTKKHGANTGNYDPTCDCYWTDFYCTLCEKSWREEGSK